MLIDLRDAPLADRGLMNAIVAPRPIAWIGSRDREGRRNLAPFSHFNVASGAPPFISVSMNTPEDRPRKDTLANILDTGVFSVNLVSEDLLRQMVATSAPLPPGTDEAAELGIAVESCDYVAAPRVARAPATLECRLYRTIEIEPEREGDTLSTLVLGRVVAIRLADECLDEKQRFDPQRAALVARAAGIQYLTVRETVAIPAPFKRAGS